MVDVSENYGYPKLISTMSIRTSYFVPCKVPWNGFFPTAPDMIVSSPVSNLIIWAERMPVMPVALNLEVMAEKGKADKKAEQVGNQLDQLDPPTGDLWKYSLSPSEGMQGL